MVTSPQEFYIFLVRHIPNLINDIYPNLVAYSSVRLFIFRT